MRVALCVLLGAWAALAVADDTPGMINWHEEWSVTQAAARESQKPILAYVYERGHFACVQTEENTLPHPEVMQRLRQFECLALNGTSSRARPFAQQFGVGARSEEDRGWQMKFSAIPVYVFIMPDGTEFLRAYGYFPPSAFNVVLDRVLEMVSLLSRQRKEPRDVELNMQLGRHYIALERPVQAMDYFNTAAREAPQNAVLHAEIGHLLLGAMLPPGEDGLEPPNPGKPFLERAIQLDPDNALGARENAELDLILLSIPDDPDAAFNKLVNYKMTNRQSPRRLEIDYYMAVAQLAAGRLAQAERILQDFEALQVSDDPDSDYRSPWTEQAIILLKQIRDISTQG